MNKWMKQGLLGIALASTSMAAFAADKKDNKDANARPEAVESSGHQSIDAQDYAGGSKLKDRMLEATGMSVEFATVESIEA
jgi:hypothetical protein